MSQPLPSRRLTPNLKRSYYPQPSSQCTSGFNWMLSPAQPAPFLSTSTGYQVAGEPSTDLRLPLNVTTPAEPATNSQSPPDNIASQTLVQSPTSTDSCVSCLACADTLNFLQKPRRDASPNSVRCIDSCQAGDETPTSTELCIVLLSRG